MAIINYVYVSRAMIGTVIGAAVYSLLDAPAVQDCKKAEMFPAESITHAQRDLDACLASPSTASCNEQLTRYQLAIKDYEQTSTASTQCLPAR